MSKKSSDFKKIVKEDKLRTLEKICNKKDFHRTWLGNNYCGLKASSKIDCKYMGKEKDQNDLYPCLNPKWNSKKDYSKKKIIH